MTNTHFFTGDNQIKARMATPLEEKLTDLAQPLLEIAEGKRSIDEWNDRLIDLLNEATHSLQEAKAESRKDKERLDFLDRCNKVLNDHYGTDYGWELILNHNITRLMSGHLDRIDLNDAHGGDTRYKSCREAIDKALSTLNTKDSLKQEEEA